MTVFCCVEVLGDAVHDVCCKGDFAALENKATFVFISNIFIASSVPTLPPAHT